MKKLLIVAALAMVLAGLAAPMVHAALWESEEASAAAVALNTAKETNVSTALEMGTVDTTNIAITSDGGADDVTLPAATNAAAGVATAAQITALEADTLNDLSDVDTAGAATDYVLKKSNGIWVASPSVTASGTVGTTFYMDDTEIIATGTDNDNVVGTLSKFPISTAEVVDTATVTTNSALMEAYLYDTALGGTSISAGEWLFTTYASVSSVLSGRDSSILRNIYRVVVDTSTVTITGTDVSRTATAAAGTPFASDDDNADKTLAGYLQTPNGLYQITGYVSATEVTIATPTTYTNETAVAFSTWKYQFGSSTGTITAIDTAYEIHQSRSAREEITTLATDKIAEIVFGVGTDAGSTDINYTHNGSDHYSNFRSPLVTRHNDLPGLQGGSAAERYHLTSAQHTISTQAADTTLDGYLSTTDWDTFDGKISNVVEDETPQLFDDLDGQGSYLTNVQNFPDMLSGGPGYWFDGVDDVITVADDAKLDITGDLTIIAGINTTDPAGGILGKFETAGQKSFQAWINSNRMAFYISDDGTTIENENATTAVNDGQNHVLSWVYDNSANTVDYYIDGNSDGTGTFSTETGVLYSGTSDVTIGLTETWIYGGSFFDAKLFNLKLTAAEVKAFSNGAAIPYKYIGASQTNMITATNDQDFSGGTIGNWVVFTDSGNGTCVYDAGPGAVGTGLLTVGATPGTDTGSQILSSNVATLKQSKIYKVKTAIYIPSANNNWTQIKIEMGYEAGTWTEIAVVEATLTTEDSWQTISTIFQSSSDIDVRFRLTGYSTTTGDLLYFDNVSITQIGCVLDLNKDGVGHNTWVDNSGNGLHGAVSGALPTNLPTNHREKYIDLTVTGNTSFTLPQGYKITSIIVHNTTANALTGGLDVGLTTNGVEIVSGEAIGANAEVVCTLVESGTIGGTFTTADDTVYFSDGNDDANFDSAELEITVSMERISL